MIKKIIVSLLLINTFLFSGNINLRSIQAEYANGSVEIVISAQDENAGGFPNKNSKDWVGIYSKGASNAWGNVKAWSWVKDFGAEKDGDAVNIIGANLQPGEYEVRYFLNNSYKTYKKSSFKVAGGGDNTITLEKVGAVYENGEIYFYVKHDWHKPLNNGPKDWVGLYKKGASNAWGNVLIWAWAKDFKNNDIGHSQHSNQKINLKNGEYEVRYFRNNSFTTYKKSSFKVNKPSINLGEVGAFDEGNGRLLVYIESTLDTKIVNKYPKDWIGIYKKGASNAWGNVKAWIWAKDLNNVMANARLTREWEILKNVNLQPGEYEVRYFLNNSFTTYKKSSFKVK